MLSCACRNAAVRVSEGRIFSVLKRDNNVRFVINPGSWFKQMLAGYLVDVTHEFGGPAISNLEGALESNSE